MQEWADVHGTRLKWLASYLCGIIHRTPFARTVCPPYIYMVAANTCTHIYARMQSLLQDFGNRSTENNVFPCERTMCSGAESEFELDR